MATASLGHAEVKAIEDSLEVSPSAHQPSSSIYSGSDQNPAAKHKSAGKASADKAAEKPMGVGRKRATG